MNIDIKRLEHDADYWDEVAPEGATHYVPKRFDWDAAVFWRIEGGSGVEAWAVTDTGLVYYPDPTWTEDSFTAAIPRPNKPEQEWVPEGWKLVPVTPTPEMLISAQRVIYSYDLRLIFEAMLEASPQPPQEQRGAE